MEALVETLAPPVLGANLTGTISAAAAGVAVVGVGTLFVAEVAVGDVISAIDANGERIYKTVITVTDDLNIVVFDNFVAAVAALSAVKNVTIHSPYFMGNDTRAEYPNKIPIYMPALTNYLRAPIPVRLTTPVYWIDESEGITVKTVYIRMPYQYTLADNPIDLSFFYTDETGVVNTLIPELGVNGEIFTQIENTEIPINQFVPPYAVAIANANRWSIYAAIQGAATSQATYAALTEANQQGGPYVSNINAPVELNGDLLSIAIGMRFTHGIALTN